MKQEMVGFGDTVASAGITVIVIRKYVCYKTGEYVEPSSQNCPRYPFAHSHAKLPGESELVPLTQLPLFLHRGDVIRVPLSMNSHASSTITPHGANS